MPGFGLRRSLWRGVRWLRLALPATAFVVGHVPEAEACGGTFCDAGPQSMPVDQTGENILFVVGEGWVEAHIQIQYEGDPEQFAWIVPMTAEPEITPGSDRLFDSMLTATVPTFTLTRRSEGCDDDGPAFGCAMKDEAANAEGFGSSDTAATDGGEPEVLDTGVAGAFEYAVLSGGTVDGVVTWLDDNGYAQDEEAPEILGSYLSEGFLFVAFKLRGGTSVEEIHPVVLRYAGDEPCVPIRLTRIAAKADMGVRVFFLGQDRVAPTNYRSVRINPLLIDWVNLAANYEEIVTRAVDIPGSDGHGFVTEYAGPSTIPSEGLLDSAWDAGRFVGIEPTLVVDELEAQGLMRCLDVEGCSYAHPLVEGLLRRYLPRPTGVDADDFYGCLSCYADLIDVDAWSDTELAAAIEERIIGPAEHAIDLLGAHPYLTRMYTTLSPHEMTEDPLFHQNPDLPDVTNVYTATRVNVCDGTDYIELDDGRRIALDDAGLLPDDMPWAATVEEVPAQGAPMTVADLSEDIENARNRWNAQMGLDDGEGCSCRSSRSLAGAFWLLSCFGFLALARRRPGER